MRTERISEIYAMFHLGFFYFISMYWNIQNTDTCQSSGNKDRERKLEHTPKHTSGANINSLPCEMIGQHNEGGTPDILFCLKASFAHVGDETFQIAGLRSNSHFFKEGVISVGRILCWGKVTVRTRWPSFKKCGDTAASHNSKRCIFRSKMTNQGCSRHLMP